MTPFLLRRLKSDVAVEVPPKREVVVYAPLVKKQEIFYSAIVNKTIRKLLGNNQVFVSVFWLRDVPKQLYFGRCLLFG